MDFKNSLAETTFPSVNRKRATLILFPLTFSTWVTQIGRFHSVHGHIFFSLREVDKNLRYLLHPQGNSSEEEVVHEVQKESKLSNDTERVAFANRVTYTLDHLFDQTR